MVGMNAKGIIIVIAIVGMLCFTAIPVTAYDNDPVEVDDSFYNGTEYANQRNLVRFDNGTLMYVYADSAGIPTIGYAISEDDGVTWDLMGDIGDEALSLYPCVAKDSHERVWCAYKTTEMGGDYQINVTYYEDGVWETPVNVNSTGVSDQYDPFVCINSQDDVYVLWDENITEDMTDYWQVMAVNFTFAQFPDSIPAPTRIYANETDQEYPVAAFDSEDTIHVTWQNWDSGNETIGYTYREDGETEYEVPITITDTDFDFDTPSICVDDNGTVYVTCILDYDNGTTDIYVIYGEHPNGTDFVNLTDELDHATNAYSLSCGWLNDELQIVYADTDTNYISYIHGIPEGVWEQEISISESVGSYMTHSAPSIRWAYYNEHTVVEYGFYDYDPTLMDYDGPWLYYQQIHSGSPTDEIIDQINALFPVVVVMMSFLILVAVLRVIIISFKKGFKN
jgi:hypothetical protein